MGKVTLYSAPQWSSFVAQLRNDRLSTSEDIANMFDFSQAYMGSFYGLIQNKGAQLAKQVYATAKPSGIALYSFGSQSRFEMTGCSDLDVLVIRANDDPQHVRFRDLFVKEMEPYPFTKVDTPCWGSLDDCVTYMNTSVTEADQLWEAEFIWGDRHLHESLMQKRKRLFTPEKAIETILFQKKYFDQYYASKEKDGEINLKYTHGGIRDFLFPMWSRFLSQGLEQKSGLKEPMILRGISTLRNNGYLTDAQADTSAYSASFLTYLRDVCMNANHKDKDGIFLTGTNRLPQLSDAITVEHVRSHLSSIASVKRAAYTYARDVLQQLRPLSWSQTLDSIEQRKKIYVDAVDPMLTLMQLWRNDAIPLTARDDYFARCAQHPSWTVLASAVAQPQCPSAVVDMIAQRGLQHGYEYLLEIAGRHTNVLDKTLHMIDEAPVESRFKTPARAKLSAQIKSGVA